MFIDILTANMQDAGQQAEANMDYQNEDNWSISPPFLQETSRFLSEK